MKSEKGSKNAKKLLMVMAVILLAAVIAIPYAAVASTDDASADSGIVIQVKSSIVYDRNQVTVEEADELGENDIVYTVTGYTGARVVEFSTYSEGSWSAYSSDAPFAAGTYKVKVTVDGHSSEAQFIINKKELTLPNATAGTKPYDKSTIVTDFIGTGNLSGVCSGDTINMDKDGMVATVPSVDVGVHTVTMSGIVLTGVNSENYYLTYPTDLTISVQSLPLTVSVEGTVIQDRAYNGSADVHDQVKLGKLSGILPGDVVTIDSFTAHMNDPNVGVEKEVTIVVTLGGADKGNYNINAFPETITIYKADPAMSTDPTGKTDLKYKGIDQVLINAGTTSDGTILYKLGADGSYSESLPVATSRGTYSVYYKIVGDSNHNDKSFTDPVSASIGKAVLTISSVAVSQKAYDGNTTATISGVVFTGLQNGETLVIGTDYTVTGSSFADKNAGTKNVTGSVSLTSTPKASNYEISVSSFTSSGTITAKAVELTLGNESIGYDGTTKTKAVQISTGIGSEKLTATYTAYAVTKGVYTYAASAGAGKYTVSWADGTGGLLSNYTPSVKSGAGTFTIGGKEISIIGTTTNTMLYSGGYDVSEYVNMGTLSGVAVGDDVHIKSGWTATVTNKNVGTGRAVTFSIELTGDDASNYTLKPLTGVTITIEKYAITVTGATVTPKQYDRSTSGTVTAVTFSGLQGEETLVLDTDFTATGTFDSENAGTTAVSVYVELKNIEKANNYAITNPTYDATSSITPRSVSLAVTDIPAITYDRDTSYSAVEISTGLDTEKLTAICIAYTYKAGTYTFATSIAEGKYTVLWSNGTGGLVSNYNVSVSSGTDFTINQKTISMKDTAVNASMVYNGTVNVKSAVTAIGTLDGVISPDNVSIKTEWTATVTDKNVGTGKAITFGIELDGADAANYKVIAPSKTIEITKAPLTITGATVTSKAYDGNTTGEVTAVTFSGLQGEETLVLDTDFTATGVFKSANAGTTKADVTVSLKSTKANNYSIGSTPFEATSEITKKAVSLAVANIPAITYDRSTKVSSVEISTGVGTEKLTATCTAYTYKAGTYTYAASAAAEKYTVAWTNGTGGLASNYDVTTSSGSDFVINQKVLTISGTTADMMTYSGSNNVKGSVHMGTLGVVETGDDVKIKDTWTATVGDKNVGTGKIITFNIELDGNDESNYTLTSMPIVSMTIDWALLTISSATVKTKIYDGNTTGKVTAVTFSGLKNGETLTLGTDFTASGTYTSANVGTTTAKVTVTLIDTSATANNYKMSSSTPSDATGSITQKSFGVNLIGKEIVYDRSTKTVDVEYSTGVGSEKLTATYTAYSYLAGTYGYSGSAGSGHFTVTWSDGTGGLLSNYIPSVNSGANFTIKQKTITVTGTTVNASMIYNGTVNVKSAVTAIGTLDGVISPDNVSIKTGWTATVTDKNVGSGKAITFGLELEGDDAANYKVTAPSKTIEITKAPLTITGATVTSKPYDGNTTGEVTAVTFSGLQNSETLALDTDFTAEGTFGSKNAGTTAVSVAVSLKSTDKANNYSISNSPYAASSSITKKALTVNLPDKSIEYDGSTKTTTENISTGVGSEYIVATYTAYSYVVATYTYAVTAGAGYYTVALGDGSGDLDNYETSYGSKGTFKITQKEIEISSSGTYATSRAYNGSADVTADVHLGTLTGYISGDATKVSIKSGWTAAMNDKHVGTDKAITFTNLELEGDAAGNYKLKTPSLKITITQLSITVSSATVQNKDYDGTTSGTVTSVTFDKTLANSELTLGTHYTASATFANKNVGSSVSASVSVTLGDNVAANNYKLTTSTCASSAKISQKDFTLNIPNVTKVYDRNIYATKYVDTGTLSEQIEIKYMAYFFTPGVYTYAESPDSGKYTISLSDYTGSKGNYNITFGSKGTFEITQKELTISTSTGLTRDYDGTENVTSDVGTLTLNGVLLDDVDYVTIATGWTATIGDKNVGVDKAVTFHDLSLTGSCASSYSLKELTDVKITITALSISVSTAMVYGKTYNGLKSGTVNTVDFSDDLADSDLTKGTDYTASATFASKDVGTSIPVTVTVTLGTTTAAKNFTLSTASCDVTGSIIKATVALPLPAASKIYNNDATIQKTVDTGVNSENLTVTYTAYSVNQGTYTYSATAAAGKYTIAWTDGTGDTDNYTISVSTSNSFTINKKELTLPDAVVTSARDYDGTTNVKSQVSLGTLSGIVSGDGSDVKVKTDWTATVTNANAGSDKAVTITANIEGTGYGNYYLTVPTTLKVTINKLSISVSSAVVAQKNYDGKTTGTVSSVTFDKALANSDLTIVTDYSASVLFVNGNANDNAASTVTVTLGTSTAAKNFTLSTASCGATSKIAKAPVTFSLQSKSKTYDGNGDLFYYIDTGVNNEDLTVVYHAFTANQGTYTYSSTAAAGKYIVGWADRFGEVSNYDITVGPSPGTFTIDKAELTLSPTSTSRDYNGSDVVTGNITLGDVSGRVGSDDVSVATTGWTAKANDKNVGVDKAVTFTGLSLTGTAAGNYKLTEPTDVKITITALAINVSSAVVAQKNYDGLKTGTVSSVTFDKALANSDLAIATDYSASVTFTYAKADDNAASTVTVTLGTSTAAKNFTLSTASCAATSKIAKAPVTLNLPDASKTYNNDAMTQKLVNTGVNSETLLLTYTAHSVNQGTYTYSETGGSGTYMILWTDGSGKIANYSVTVGTAGNYIIDKATLTLPDASATPRIYNGSADVTSQITLGALSGLATGDTASLVYVSSTWTAAMDDANVGSNKTVNFTGLTLAGDKSGNYNLTTPTVKITITKAASVIDSVPVALSPTYTGSPLALVSAGTCTGGEMMYKLDSGAYTSNVPKATNASDSYTVYYYVKGDANHNDTSEFSLTATIQKAQSAITADPAANALTYTGEALVLVTDGECTGGTMMYKISTDADYSSSKPTAVNAGTYSVLFYVKGDSNHLDSAAGSVAVTIDKADVEIIVYPVARTVTYNSELQNLMKEGTCTGGTFEYADVLNPYATTVPQAELAKDYVVYYRIIGDSNHNDVAEVTLTAHILKKTLTLPYAQSFPRDYNGLTDVTNNIILGSLSGKVAGDDIKISSSVWTAAVENKDAGENKPIVFTNLLLSGADKDNYILDTSSIKITINQLKLTIDDLGSKTKVYDAKDVYDTYDVTNKIGTDRITVDAKYEDKNVGNNKTITFSVTGLDADNYIAPDSLTGAKITALDTYITGLVAKDKTYDGNAVAEVIGTAVVSALIEGDVVNVVAGSAAFNDKNVGTGKTVTFSGYSLSGTDAANYNLVEQPADVTADITKLYVIITGLGVSDKTYNGNANATVTGTGSILGKIPADTVTIVDGTAKFVDKNVGTKVARFSGYSLTGTDAANYYLVAQPADVTAKIKPLDTTISGFTSEGRVYDATDVAKVIGAGTVDALVAGDTVTIAKGTAVFNSKTVGTKTVTFSGFALTGADAANYNLTAQPTDSATYEITKATLTVGGIAVKDKVYDGKTTGTFASKGTLVGVIGTDAVSLKDTMTAAFSDKKAGADKTVTLSGYDITGTDAGNYSLTAPSSVKATISKLDVTIIGMTVNDKEYDGKKTATYTGTPSVSEKVIGDEVNVSSSLPASMSVSFADKNAGSNKVVNFYGFSLSGADADNYNLVSQPTGKATITHKSVTISGIISADKVYDGSDSALVLGFSTINGKVDGDSLTVVSGTAKFTTKYVGNGKTVNFSGFALGGDDATNYVLTAQPAPVTNNITPKALTVSGIVVKDKVYDGTTAGTFTNTGTLVGVVGSDTVSLDSGMAAEFNDKNVGTGKTVTLSGYALIGNDKDNYSLTAPSSVTASISKLDTIITGIGIESKTYNGSASATVTGTGVVSAKIGTDDVSVENGVAVFNDRNAGTGKIVIFSGFSLTGGDADNYNLKSQPAPITETIAKKDTTISGFTSEGRVYDGTTVAKVIGTGTVDALVSGDTVTIVKGTAVFNSKTAGTGKTVTFSGFALTGTDAANYNLTAQPTDSATYEITKATLTVKGITVKDKIYDRTTNGTFGRTGTLVGVIGSDTVSLDSGMTADFDDKNVGSNKTVTLSGYSLVGSDADNYSLVAPSSVTASITKLDTIITGITSQDKTYDGTATADVIGTGVVSAKITGDDVSVVNGTAAFCDKDVDTGKKVTFSGFSLSGGDAGNYNLVAQPASVNNDITKKDITVAAGTAVPTKTYDGTTYWVPTGQYFVFTGVETCDEGKVILAGKFNFDDATTSATKVIATDLILAGDEAHNYNLTTSTYDITGASITAKEISGSVVSWIDLGSGAYVYNGLDQSSTIKAYFFGIEGKVDLTITFLGTSGAAYGDTVFCDAGTYTATATNVDPNYKIGSDNKVTNDYTIGLRTITFMWSGSIVKVYDGIPDMPILYVGNIVSSDNITVQMTSLEQTEVGDHTATAVFNDPQNRLDNYGFDSSSLSVDWKIVAKSVTIAGKDLSFTYDGNQHQAVLADVSAFGIIGGQSLTGVTFTGTYSGTDVISGTYNVSGIVIKAGDVDKTPNYTFVTDGPWSFEITKRSLGAGAGTAVPTKVYDGNTEWTPTDGAYAFIGLVPGDDVTLSATYNFNSKDVSKATYVTTTGLSISGTKASNYTLTTTSFNIVGAKITPATLTVEAAMSYVPTKVYDGESVWTPVLDCYKFTGLIPGDDVTLVASYNYTDNNVTTANKKVIVTDLSLAGNDATNYDLATTAFEYGSAEITARTLNVTPASGQFKYYAQPDPVLVCAYTNNVPGETPGFSGALTRDAGEKPGAYMMYQGTIALADNGAFIASNYAMSFTGGVNFNIVTQYLMQEFFTVDVSDEVYDGTAKIKSVQSVLTLGEHYTVTYLNNVNAGTATIHLEGIGDYSGTLDYHFTIQKKGVAVPEPKYYLYTGDGVYFDIPESPYYVEDSGNPRFGIEPATYSFHFTLNDPANYKWADDKFDGNYSVYITIRELTHVNEQGVIDVILLSDYGFRFDLTPSVKHVEDLSKYQEYNLKGTPVSAIDIKLIDKIGTTVQPYGPVTIKVLLPSDCNGGWFDVYHIYDGTSEKVGKHIEIINGQKYGVFTVEHFSDFVLVKKTIDIPMSLLLIFLIIDTIIALIIYLRRKKKGEEEQ